MRIGGNKHKRGRDGSYGDHPTMANHGGPSRRNCERTIGTPASHCKGLARAAVSSRRHGAARHSHECHGFGVEPARCSAISLLMGDRLMKALIAFALLAVLTGAAQAKHAPFEMRALAISASHPSIDSGPSGAS